MSDFFPNFQPENFSEVVKVAMYMTRGASLGITFFARIFRFRKFSVVGAGIFTTPGDLFQQSLQNSFAAVRVTIWGKVVYFKSFCIYLKPFGKLWKYLFHQKLKTDGPNCNLYVQKSNPKIFLIEYFDFSAQAFVRIFKPAFKTTRKTICRKIFPYRNFSFLDRFFWGSKDEIWYFWGKIEQVVQACPEKQSDKNVVFSTTK